MSEKYMKVVKLGTGTFGQAWLVTSVCSSRNYVMKEVKVSEMSDQDIKKTQVEATVLARCKHVNVVRYKESFLRDGPLTMCLVMEYADGGDLSEQVQYAKEQKILIPEHSILYWFVQVIFAVQYLHSNDILHRDLKTQNIFLTRDNMVKVGDFGIARFLRGKQDLATTATGTPYYLSPEICQRKPYNHKSDMWAVGCILYELCTLSHPFEADNFDVLTWRIMCGVYTPISTQYSELLHKMVSVFLRRDPEKRPSADDILMVPALRQLVQHYIKKYENFIKNYQNSRNSSTGIRRHGSSGSICDCGANNDLDDLSKNSTHGDLCEKGPRGAQSKGSNGSTDPADNSGVEVTRTSSNPPPVTRRTSSSKPHSKEASSSSESQNQQALDHTYENIAILRKETLSETSIKGTAGCPLPLFDRPSRKPKFSAYARSPPPAPPPSPQTPCEASPRRPFRRGTVSNTPPTESTIEAKFRRPSLSTPTRQVLVRSVHTQTPPSWQRRICSRDRHDESFDSGKESEETRSRNDSDDNEEYSVFEAPKPLVEKSVGKALKDTFTIIPIATESEEIAQAKLDL